MQTPGLIHFQRVHEVDYLICYMSSCEVWLQLHVFGSELP